MASVNIDSIMDKIYAFEASDKGRKKMRKKYDEYVKNGTSKTQAGSRVLTRLEMEKITNDFIDILTEHAAGCSLPESVLAHFSSLKATKPKRMADGSYTVDISFGDDLFRPSLDPGKYGGVSNIVAIFNNGYPKNKSRIEAISHVEGWWHGKNTMALGFRPGLYFMQSAVNEFNAKYAGMFDIWVELAEIYDSE